MSNLTWNERINAISVNPDMATRDDIAGMAADLQDGRARIAARAAAQALHPASEPPEWTDSHE